MLYKIVLLGETAVGKTTLRRSYMGKTLVKNYVKTLGFDFAIKKHEKATVQIWDIAGEMRLDGIKSFVKGSSGAILLFDLTNPSLVQQTKDWLDLLFDEFNSNIHLALVGNKLDLVQNSDYLEKEALEGVERFILNTLPSAKYRFFETSALVSIGVEAIFDWMIPCLVGEEND